MSEQEILEGNLLIANFLGLESIDSGDDQDWFYIDEDEQINNIYTITKEAEYVTVDELLYHLSFHYLMKVVEKIQKLENRENPAFNDSYKIDFIIDLLNGVTLTIDKTRIYFCTSYGEGQLLDALYGGVIVFIKWFNKNKKDE